MLPVVPANNNLATPKSDAKSGDGGEVERQRQPGAPGCDPQPPAVEFTDRWRSGLITTVPSSVVPCEVH
jgi:hypothetical protein